MSVETYTNQTDVESDDSQLSWQTDETTAETHAPAIDMVRLYLNQMGKIALLNAAEEVELAKDIEAGLFAQNLLAGGTFESEEDFYNLQELQQQGEASKKRLVEANLRLVVPIAKRYRGKGVPFLDLIQEGNEGLMIAMQKFDYAKGFKFSTFASFKISERIIRSFFTQGYDLPVREKLGEKLSKLRNVTRRLNESLGRVPTKEELAIEMNMDIQQVVELLYTGHDAISLDLPVGEFDTPLGTLLEDEDSNNPVDMLIKWSMREDVAAILSQLGSEKETILRGQFGFDQEKIITHTALSRKLKIPLKRVKELEQEAMTELKNDERNHILRDYLY